MVLEKKLPTRRWRPEASPTIGDLKRCEPRRLNRCECHHLNRCYRRLNCRRRRKRHLILCGFYSGNIGELKQH